MTDLQIRIVKWGMQTLNNWRVINLGFDPKLQIYEFTGCRAEEPLCSLLLLPVIGVPAYSGRWDMKTGWLIELTILPCCCWLVVSGLSSTCSDIGGESLVNSVSKGSVSVTKLRLNCPWRPTLGSRLLLSTGRIPSSSRSLSSPC